VQGKISVSDDNRQQAVMHNRQSPSEHAIFVASSARSAYSRRIMRFFMILSVLIVGLTVETTEAKAFQIIGAGVDSCGTWINDRNQSNMDSLQDEQWVLGLLSGVGFMGENATNPFEGDGCSRGFCLG
jgi:hypothetical protein